VHTERPYTQLLDASRQRHLLACCSHYFWSFNPAKGDMSTHVYTPYALVFACQGTGYAVSTQYLDCHAILTTVPAPEACSMQHSVLVRIVTVQVRVLTLRRTYESTSTCPVAAFQNSKRHAEPRLRFPFSPQRVDTKGEMVSSNHPTKVKACARQRLPLYPIFSAPAHPPPPSPPSNPLLPCRAQRKTLTAMTTHAMLTYGLRRSPTRAAFQKGETK
jgi:hypothetical protein